MIVPSIGTSIVAFKLICARLQLHASGASKPRLASSASAGNSGCSLKGQSFLLDDKLKAVHRFSCAGSLEVTMSSNQVRRTDLTPIALAELVFLMLSLRRL